MNMSDFEPFHAYACRHRHCSPAAALCRSNHTLQMMLNIIAQTSACSSRLSGDHNGTLLSGAFKFGAPAGTLSFPTGPAKLGTTPAITASGKASEAQPPSTPHCMPAVPMSFMLFCCTICCWHAWYQRDCPSSCWSGYRLIHASDERLPHDQQRALQVHCWGSCRARQQGPRQRSPHPALLLHPRCSAPSQLPALEHSHSLASQLAAASQRLLHLPVILLASRLRLLLCHSRFPNGAHRWATLLCSALAEHSTGRGSIGTIHEHGISMPACIDMSSKLLSLPCHGRLLHVGCAAGKSSVCLHAGHQHAPER